MRRMTETARHCSVCSAPIEYVPPDNAKRCYHCHPTGWLGATAAKCVACDYAMIRQRDGVLLCLGCSRRVKPADSVALNGTVDAHVFKEPKPIQADDPFELPVDVKYGLDALDEVAVRAVAADIERLAQDIETSEGECPFCPAARFKRTICAACRRDRRRAPPLEERVEYGTTLMPQPMEMGFRAYDPVTFQSADGPTRDEALRQLHKKLHEPVPVARDAAGDWDEEEWFDEDDEDEDFAAVDEADEQDRNFFYCTSIFGTCLHDDDDDHVHMSFAEAYNKAAWTSRQPGRGDSAVVYYRLSDGRRARVWSTAQLDVVSEHQIREQCRCAGLSWDAIEQVVATLTLDTK